MVFPEFAHAAPVFPTVARAARQARGADSQRAHRPARAQGARARHLHPERLDDRSRSALAGRGLQHDLPDRARRASSTSTARSTRGFPYEVHASPHDLEGYDEPLFPVADTPIGRIGCAICYDWLFPEAIRQLAANGAEVLIRVSAYMDPWGATEPMNWWTLVNRCRALENIAYVVAANQGASLRHYPPYSWPGGSQVVDFDGRMLAEASPGPGERIVVAPIDISALRHERETRRGHHMLAHLRTEAYPVYSKAMYPAAGSALSYEANNERIDRAKARVQPTAASGALDAGSRVPHPASRITEAKR